MSNERRRDIASLDRSFYARPTLEVARDLLGCRLYRRIGRRLLHGRIVEVEAYTDDAASHSRGGKRTPRNAIMFGPAGRSYVYFTYGMHYCLNAVAKEAEGVPGAVLIRGLDEIDRAAGPALLCRALSIDLAQNGLDLTRDATLWIAPPSSPPTEPLVQTTRIGIRQAADLPWRFYLQGSPGVSKVAAGRSRDRSSGGDA
jgi:DNA-3-methyladenine glycosylase